MDLLAGESLIWRGRPSWRSMLAFYLKWGVLALIPIAVIVVANVVLDQDWPWGWFVLATIVAFVLIFAFGWLFRIGTSYMITDRRIMIRRGILSRRERSTHIDRVQNVNTSQTLMQRLLGVGTLDFDTAGTDQEESDFQFVGIEDPHGLRQRIDLEYRQRLEERLGRPADPQTGTGDPSPMA